MNKLVVAIRGLLLLAALVLTVFGFFPSRADALKSCEYYCGPAGPYSCYVTETFVCPADIWW